MPRKKSNVEASLKSKGFEQIEGDHHYFFYVTMDGKRTTIRTKTSHTPKMKEIPDNLLSQMAKQCQLSRPEFLRLVDCPLDQEGYEEILSKKDFFK